MSEIRDTGATENKSQFSSSNSEKGWAARHIGWIIVILVLLVAAVGIYIWKEIEANNYEKELLKQEQFYQGEVRRIVKEESQQYLQKIMMPFVWAVRTEMIRENMEQVNDYMRQFVKNENIEMVVVVNNQGQIISSTNQKLIGENFAQNFSEGILSTNEVAVQERQDGKLIGSAPIVGYDARLGTLVMVYQPNNYSISYSE